ncbi:MAG: phosphomannomutase [Ruegeria sp.]
MSPKFGTSGLRGLVTELTDDLVADHVRAFLSACPHGGQVYVGWDLRPSSPRIADAVCAAAAATGVEVVRVGALPTPALALAAIEAGAAAVMVTGSHIPADRNGLKFYVPTGEISKDDETAILAHLGRATGADTGDGMVRDDPNALDAYHARYVAAFGPGALNGLRIGVYEHSSVARDVLGVVLQTLGAETVGLARSDTFIPVDTEAVDPDTRAQLAAWAQDHELDAIVSTDGDGDRPMVADATGRIVPGDVLGPLTARLLGARQLVTPVSSNSMIADMPAFDSLQRTRIGSPYVIAGMERTLTADPDAPVAGYEANGGFLLGFTARGPAGPLPPLMTRDSLLPIIAPLVAARRANQGLAELMAALPARHTAADRLQGIEPAASAPFLATLMEDAARRAIFFDTMPAETGTDVTDGLRVTFEGGDVVHLRPSGNAPEFRCYAEAGTADAARTLVASHLEKLRDVLA